VTATPTDRHRLLRPLGPLLAVALLLLLFWAGAMRNSRLVNTDPKKSDQGSYIEYAIKLAETDRQWVGNRNQMPLVPALYSFFYRPEMDQRTFFETGKRLNILFTMGVCLLLAALYLRLFPPHAALNLALITAFCHLIFRAPYFKAEVPYYFLITLAFLAGAYAVRRCELRWAAAFGLLCALAHYCKASTQPILAVFVAVLAARQIFAFRGARDASAPPPRRRWMPSLCILATLAVFLGLLAPYLIQSKRVYGRYFYNVNSTFYVWYDSWQEVKRGTRAAGDRVGWPKLPPDQIPSARKYFREHTPGQIAGRLLKGAALQTKNLIGAHGSFKYLLLAALCAGTLAWQHRRELRARLAPVAWPILFAVGYVGLTFAATAWYSPLADGSRFVMALYLPLLVCGFWLVTRLPDATVRIAGRPASVATTFQRVVTLILLIEIPFNLIVRLADEFGGA